MITSDPYAPHLGGFCPQSSAKPFVLQSTSRGGGIQDRASSVWRRPRREPSARLDPSRPRRLL